jgi:hypothetical protein
MEFWYVEVWCNCLSGDLKVETYAPFSSESLAQKKKDECLQSPFHPHKPENYTIGKDNGEILPDGRIICGQHVFKAESLDDGTTTMECRWLV